MGFALTGARVFTGEAFLDDHAVVIEGAHVMAVVPRDKLRDTAVTELDGGILAPGFIDVQVNGGGARYSTTILPSIRCATSRRRTGASARWE